MISEDDLADPTNPTGGPEGASCGKVTMLLLSDGDPSPTLLTALTRNWYDAAAFRLVKRTHRCSADTLLISVTQLGRGSVIGPKSDTSRRCTIYFRMGLWPSKLGVQVTLTALWDTDSKRTAWTLTGGNGSSITLSRAKRVSFPPGDITAQVYSPTSAGRTAWISRVPSLWTETRWLLVVFNVSWLWNQSMRYGTLGSFDTLHWSVAVWPKRTWVSTGGWMIWVLTKTVK